MGLLHEPHQRSPNQQPFFFEVKAHLPFVISTGAYADFLPRSLDRQGCAFSEERRMKLVGATKFNRKIRGA